MLDFYFPLTWILRGNFCRPTGIVMLQKFISFEIQIVFYIANCIKISIDNSWNTQNWKINAIVYKQKPYYQSTSREYKGIQI